jgi:uncharacterized protein
MDRLYRVDRDDTCLAGFSLAGLFVLQTLFRHADSFQRYVAASPSLWWHERVIFDLDREYAARHRDLSKSLCLSAGSLERLSFRGAPDMVSNVAAMVEALAGRKYPSLRLNALILAGESHTTGIAPSFVKGLLRVFRGPDDFH